MEFSSKIKSKIQKSKRDLDRKILDLAQSSVKGIKQRVAKASELDLNGDIPRQIAQRVLNKAQEIRKSLTAEELVKMSKQTTARVAREAATKTAGVAQNARRGSKKVLKAAKTLVGAGMSKTKKKATRSTTTGRSKTKIQLQ